jgi:hypothetical protein
MFRSNTSILQQKANCYTTPTPAVMEHNLTVNSSMVDLLVDDDEPWFLSPKRDTRGSPPLLPSLNDVLGAGLAPPKLHIRCSKLFHYPEVLLVRAVEEQDIILPCIFTSSKAKAVELVRPRVTKAGKPLQVG